MLLQVQLLLVQLLQLLLSNATKSVHLLLVAVSMQAHTGYTLCLVHEHGHEKSWNLVGAKMISRIGIQVRKLCESDSQYYLMYNVHQHKPSCPICVH